MLRVKRISRYVVGVGSKVVALPRRRVPHSAVRRPVCFRVAVRGTKNQLIPPLPSNREGQFADAFFGFLLKTLIAVYFPLSVLQIHTPRLRTPVSKSKNPVAAGHRATGLIHSEFSIYITDCHGRKTRIFQVSHLPSWFVRGGEIHGPPPPVLG